MSGKKDLFLSKTNTAYLIKTFYNLNQTDGGEVQLKDLQEQVPQAMQKWSKLDELDSYESLNMDILAEVKSMDQDFIKSHSHLWQATGIANLPKTYAWSAEDYKTLDFALPDDEDTIVNNEKYRNDNRPYLIKTKAHTRNYDRSNDGLYAGRSLEQPTKGYDMSALKKLVDKPYHLI